MVEHWEDCECRKCDRKRIEDLREENERLREALRQITEVTAYDQPSAVQGWEDRGRIARQALEGGGDDE